MISCSISISDLSLTIIYLYAAAVHIMITPAIVLTHGDIGLGPGPEVTAAPLASYSL